MLRPPPPKERKVLFPEQPHPEYHEDDRFHPPRRFAPPHRAPGLRLKTQHANPACPNRLGDRRFKQRHFAFLPPRALHVLLLLLNRCFNFWHNSPTPSSHHLLHCLSLHSFFSFFLSADKPPRDAEISLTSSTAHPQAHSAFGYPLSSFHTLSH